MNYLTVAEVNLAQLKENYNEIKKLVNNSTVMCAVKANAYGMGVEEVTCTLYEAGCRNYAVANISEAVEILPYVKESNILVLGCTLPQDAELLVHNKNIIQNIYSLDYAEKLSSFVCRGEKIRCHLKIDTGMNRLGFKYIENENDPVLEDIKKVYNNEKLEFEGIFTHFYNSDENEKQTFEQFDRFEKTIQILENNDIKFSIKHASNSAAIVKYKNMHLDMVRAGLILYGYSPSKDISINCKPILSLKTHVTHIHNIEVGDTVSYGANFKATKNMKIATLAIGYADGLCRNYNGYNNKEEKKATVLINGKKCEIIGNICMDQCMCDVTNVDVSIGDDVIVVGENNPVEIFSEAGNTISYEFITLLSKRAKRKYKY